MLSREEVTLLDKREMYLMIKNIVVFIFSIALLIVSAACTNPTETEAIQEPEPTSVTEADNEPEVVSSDANDESITLLFPTINETHQEYYVELTQKALEAAGYEANIELTENLPQERAIQMLESDRISILWLVQSAERDELYTPVEVGLTNSLIGHRVLLVPTGAEDAYADVATLDDFRATGVVGAFGQNWFDARVWDANDLEYVGIDGDWNVIYGMLEKQDRGIDYFSRGFTEIQTDASAHPELAIENNLMLIYDRDFRFYLSEEASVHQEILEEALQQAKNSGLMDELIRKYWADDFEALRFDERVQIKLETP